jgi:hypothetical protein
MNPKTDIASHATERPRPTVVRNRELIRPALNRL